MLVHFPVYRGYGTAGRSAVLEQAADAAKKTGLPGDRWVIDWLHAPDGASRDGDRDHAASSN